jgi:single-stranded DNA-binding protein
MSKAVVTVEGFATSDGEFVRLTEKNLDLFKFYIAVNGRHEGEETSFFPVRVWGKLAKVAAALVQKGKYIHIEGSLKQRKFETTSADGEVNVVSSIGIVAHYIDLPYEK